MLAKTTHIDDKPWRPANGTDQTIFTCTAKEVKPFYLGETSKATLEHSSGHSQDADAELSRMKG